MIYYIIFKLMFLEGICIESVKSTYITIQHFYESNKKYIRPYLMIRQKGYIMKKENVVKLYVVVAHSVADDYWSSIDELTIFSKREDAEKEKEKLENGDHKGYPVEIFERVVNGN